MNKIIFHILAIIAILFAACSSNPDVEPPVVELADSVYFVAVKDSISETGREFLSRTIGTDNLTVLFELTLRDKLRDVRVDAITYYTRVSEKERPLASGIVAYPLTGDLRGVILAGHGSIGASREAPSEQMADWMSLLALAGYMVITPDYIGYGESKHLPHPYLHAGLTASASIDMYFAVRDYMKLRGKPLASQDIYVMGYSQGGAAALAIQKLAEEKYTDEIHITGVTAGGGPYDLTFVFDQMKRGNMQPSAFVPMTILGLNYGDNLQLDMNSFFIDPLLTGYEAWILSKDFTIGEINERIGKNFLSPLLFADAPTANVQRLYTSLEDNSLIAWTPRAPLKLIHGNMDATVPVSCAHRAYNAFVQRGCSVEIKIVASDHTGTILFFILDVIEQFT